jgi:transcriptional regulator with XRE-family HTH domain
MIGAHPSELSRWENGERTVPERWQWQLARVLGRTTWNSGSKTSGTGHDNPPAPVPAEWHTSLRARREATGLSQPQLADRAGLHRGTLAQYESGRAQASLALMHRIDTILSRPDMSFEHRRVWRRTLRERYLAAGFSRSSLARALFVDARLVAEYERGHHPIGLYAMHLIDGAIAAGPR